MRVPHVDEFAWLMQELRVSLFAQELKTPVIVSVKRLEKMLAGIRVSFVLEGDCAYNPAHAFIAPVLLERGAVKRFQEIPVTMSHSEYRFSITIKSDDLAVVNCLRSLAQHSQQKGNKRIPWGGTKDIDWKRDNHLVTFRFTTPEYREGFITHAKRLLPQELWSIAGKSDNDPASRQT